MALLNALKRSVITSLVIPYDYRFIYRTNNLCFEHGYNDRQYHMNAGRYYT